MNIKRFRTKISFLSTFSIGLVALAFSATSCRQHCQCEETWVNDPDRIYVAGDQVEHQGICYEAVAQCRASACEPGTDSDDVFVVCVN